MKYCLGMEDILLPVYTPVSSKPGFSGNSGRAEQIYHVQTYEKVCALCMDGPRCKYSNMKEKCSAGSIHAPSAVGDKAAHTHCSIAVPAVLLYSATEPVLAHPKGDTHKLSPGGNKITSLVEKWDRFQSLGVVSDEVVEGEMSEGIVYSSRWVSQEFLNIQNIFEQKSQKEIA